ncbi:hypothetical protein BEP19_02935 [Ammoniphilus oxalaticus]|uniref:Cellulose synthase n=1 Tax=Ammoniphilus oxalaticus TaxID=66863 RepID=A0A419SNU5_9BACL|nr:cellulose biosynthesis cyclic di-GMP-binding regulatory protein BcsB [Ammoniphilus oxalaticus]RKD25899.1 hypothetical protein BEP19_02935 [Ammoniphilus oxalaticus]
MRYKMNKLFQRLTILVLSLLLILPSITTEAVGFPLQGRTIQLNDDIFQSDGSESSTVSIINLTAQDQVLEGMADNVEFFYEIPSGSGLDGSMLNLIVQYSELLQEGSTMTVYIDDKPFHSEALQMDRQAMEIKRPLPTEALSEGFHTIRVNFYGHISEELCADLENPANWLMILAESHLVMHTNDRSDRINMLQDYPYPFIQRQQAKTVQSVLVIPDEASASVILAALKLTNYLSHHASDQEEIMIVRESELNMISTNIIALGKQEDWTGIIRKVFNAANVKVENENLVVSNYLIRASAESKQIMFITALKDQIISDKITALTTDHFVKQLAGDQLSIDKIPTLAKEEKAERHVFQEIGIANQTLTEARKKSLNYFFQLPSYVDVEQDGTLHLKIRASKPLARSERRGNEDGAELVVIINEIPHSIDIREQLQESEESFVNVEIPIEAEQIKKAPYLTIQFEAIGLGEPKICVPVEDGRWIFVHEESYLQFGTREYRTESNFKTWPDPFVSIDSNDETVFLLPNDVPTDSLNQLQRIILRNNDRNFLDNVEIIFEKELNETNLLGKHVIIFGRFGLNLLLTTYQDQLIVDVENNRLDLSSFQFVNETAKHVAWLQPSVWDDSKIMAVFAPVQAQTTEPFLIDGLIRYINTNRPNTNIIVENNNGQIFTHQLKEGGTVAIPDSTKRDKGQVKLLPLIIFAGIFIFSMAIFILLYQKKRSS